jgi:ABC-2 type transport system ATP-binding protein
MRPVFRSDNLFPAMNETAPAIEIANLTKVFSISLRKNYVVAVEDLSLTVESGEIYGLIGPNGSGKSTTMKVVLGLMAPTSGSTKVFGIDSRSVRSRHEVGFLPENPYFYRHLTGLETLLFYGRLCGLKRAELKNRAAELLALVNLEKARDRRLAGYSKGMLQRIGLAQALIQRPRLVVLDEPTAGVDPIGSRIIRDLILQLKEDGTSVFLCSHLLEQVQEVCDRVGVIAHGKLWREGNLDDLIAIENQTELVFENASPALLEKLQALIEEDPAARFVSAGHPRTTLERLFLDIVRKSDQGRIPETGNRKSDAGDF